MLFSKSRLQGKKCLFRWWISLKLIYKIEMDRVGIGWHAKHVKSVINFYSKFIIFIHPCGVTLPYNYKENRGIKTGKDKHVFDLKWSCNCEHCLNQFKCWWGKIHYIQKVQFLMSGESMQSWRVKDFMPAAYWVFILNVDPI